MTALLAARPIPDSRSPVLTGGPVATFSILGHDPETGDSPPAQTPYRQQPTPSAEGLAGEPVAPAFCRPESLPPGEALRHGHATPRGVEARSAQPGALLVPRDGTPGVELPDWLAP